MKTNFVLCDRIIRAWNMAMFDGLDVSEAINELSTEFRSEHMTTADVNYLYHIEPENARYYECFVTTHIVFN